MIVVAEVDDIAAAVTAAADDADEIVAVAVVVAVVAVAAAGDVVFGIHRVSVVVQIDSAHVAQVQMIAVGNEDLYSYD